MTAIELVDVGHRERGQFFSLGIIVSISNKKKVLLGNVSNCNIGSPFLVWFTDKGYNKPK